MSENGSTQPDGDQAVDISILSESDRQIYKAIADGKTIKEAAALAGVSERTVYRRLKKPRFISLLREAAEEAAEPIQRTYIGLIEGSAETVEEWRRVLKDPKAKDADRIRAGAYIMQYLQEYHDRLEYGPQLDDLQATVEELEDRFGDDW